VRAFFFKEIPKKSKSRFRYSFSSLETVEIVIDQEDQTGGTGANFIFYWRTCSKKIEPLFEGVMISTYGQQGLSFTTQGKRIK